MESGSAYVTPDTSGTEKKLFYESQKLDQMHNQLGTSYASLKEKVRQYTQESDKSVSTQQKVLSGLKKIGLIAGQERLRQSCFCYQKNDYSHGKC